MKHVMVDLETLGNGSDAVIIAIGAVEFDPDIGEVLGREFYTVVDAESAVKCGMKIDAATVMWWMQQSVEAKSAFNIKGIPLPEALESFSKWFPPGATLWGNGATFDNVILANAYRLTGLERPWAFWNDRCYRTLKNLFPELKQTNFGTAHNALDDAKSQAVHAITLLKEVK